MGSKAVETGETDRRPLTGNSTGLPDSTFFRACFNCLPDSVIVTDLHRSILFLNDSAQTFTGCELSGEAP